MFIPLRTEVARRRPTVITYWIMAACVVVFLVTSVLENKYPDRYLKVFSFMALHGDMEHALNTRLSHPEYRKFEDEDPLGLIQKMELGAVNPARPWQYVTYQFMHAGWMHLLGNMLFLWVFGPVVEDRLRRWWFLAFYLAGGAFAGLVHGLFEGRVIDAGSSSALFFVPVIGASGSIAAVTGAFLVLFPLSRIDIIWFLGIIGRYAIPAWWFIGIAIARDFIANAFMGGGGVAHMAHLGGYTFGFVVAVVGLALGWIPREPFNLFTMGRQAHRRRSYKELVRKQGSGFAGDGVPARVAAPAPGRGADSRQEDDRAEKRAAVFESVRAGDVAEAARRFEAVLERYPDESLPRDAQLMVANHWFGAGRHALAAQAYETFLAKNPNDRERDETALMLALICARYLNDPERASALLRGIDRETLSEEHRALVDTVRGEIS